MNRYFSLLVSQTCVFCLCYLVLLGCDSKTETKSSAQSNTSTTSGSPDTSSNASQESATEPSKVQAKVEGNPPPSIPSEAPILKAKDISALKELSTSLVDAMASQFPNDPDAMEAKARFYRMIGKLDIAKACWEHAVEQSPDYGYAYQGLGSIAVRNSDYEGGVEHLARAVKLMPGDTTAVHELSDALMKKGDTLEAIKVLEAQVAFKPSSNDTLQLLGQARLANRDYASASEAFQKSLDLAPENHLSQQGMGAALVRLGKREEAKKWLAMQKSARSTNNVESSVAQAAERADIAARLNYVAQVYLKHERVESAMEILRYVAENEPNDEDSRRLMVKLLQQLQKPKEAIEIAKQLVQISPNNLGYRMTVGTISQRQRDWAAAQESFEYVVQTMPSRAEGYAALVELIIVSGKNKERAVDLAKTVTELRGTASDFATYGQTLAMNGNPAEAISAMRIASLKDPESQNFKNILDQLIKSQESR